uniref:Homeobox domain-containing protein n=1 Tax=Haemonchus contortus TaxID=6289 RepID=A0A7I4Y474_HAECO
MPRLNKKRSRTTFSQAQLHILEEAFARQQYLVGSERLRLAGLLNIGATQVKVWFQNRRIRWRREQRQMLLNVHHEQLPPVENVEESSRSSVNQGHVVESCGQQN